MATVLRALFALILTMGAAVVAPSSVACACSCQGLSTDEALAGVSVVFDGTVVARSQPTTGDSAEPIAYTIEVGRVYRGRVPSTVLVHSEASEASCGAVLAGQVTVFASERTGGLWTTSCSTPMDLDRSRLGVGHPPEVGLTVSPPASAPQTPPTASGTPTFEAGTWVVAGLAGTLVLAGAALWVVRRNRS